MTGSLPRNWKHTRQSLTPIMGIQKAAMDIAANQRHPEHIPIINNHFQVSKGSQHRLPFLFLEVYE
jgi:hypothetical protein